MCWPPNSASIQASICCHITFLLEALCAEAASMSVMESSTPEDATPSAASAWKLQACGRSANISHLFEPWSVHGSLSPRSQIHFGSARLRLYPQVPSSKPSWRNKRITLATFCSSYLSTTSSSACTGLSMRMLAFSLSAKVISTSNASGAKRRDDSVKLRLSHFSSCAAAANKSQLGAFASLGKAPPTVLRCPNARSELSSERFASFYTERVGRNLTPPEPSPSSMTPFEPILQDTFEFSFH